MESEFTLDRHYHPKLKKQPVCCTNPNRLQKLLIDDVKWEPEQVALFPAPVPPATQERNQTGAKTPKNTAFCHVPRNQNATN